tara:strand:- start:1389 stop:2300 length:912 start_codon:yes stop_codon:yes gene_type:complete
MEMSLDFNATGLQKVRDIKIPDIFNRRLTTGISKIDVLFNEGILPGSALTLTAQAGCGKTTFMLQMLQGLTKNGYKVGYFSGEESIYQLAYTANRVKSSDVSIANVTDIDTIKSYMNDLDLLVIDSFQALTSRTKMNSRQFEKHAVQSLTKHAKNTECTVVFIMHLTKSGDLKGGTVVPHTVDANVKITRVADSDSDDDRCIYFEKNRFGPLNELECAIGPEGYDFDAKVVREEETIKAPSKTNRKKDDIEKLMKLDTINLANAAKALDGNVTRAQYLLREQEILGNLNKEGKGRNALWSKAA